MEITQNNVFQSVKEFAANYLTTLTNQIATMAGVDVLWFRAIPQQRSTDVIFQTYTLENVECTPLEIKAVYTDTNYNDAEYQFQLMGIEYKPTLCIEVAANNWYTVTKSDGTLPQQHDIVFIPLTQKLWEVESMQPVMAMGSVTLSYKCNLKTYTPKADRHIEENLQEAINGSTVSVDSLFGEDIINEIADLVDDKQTSNTSSTTRDKYKTLPLESVYTNKTILHSKLVKSPMSYELNVDGHFVARSYYDTNVRDEFVVSYNDIIDVIKESDYRCLSLWVSYSSSDKSYPISSIEQLKKVGTNMYLKVYTNTDDVVVGDTVSLSRNTLSLFGEVDEIFDDFICLKVGMAQIAALNKISSSWTKLKGFAMSKSASTNLLSADTENGHMSIDLINGEYLLYTMGEWKQSFKLTKKLLCDTWYGIIFNLGKEAHLDIFEAEPKLNKIISISQNTKFNDNVATRYYIKPSHSKITNIRLFDIANIDIDKQIIDMISYNIKNNSHAIINDSADIYVDKAYFGQQR